MSATGAGSDPSERVMTLRSGWVATSDGVDDAGVEQLAHLGVVAGHQAHPVVGEAVDPRVADVEHDPVLVPAGDDDGHPGDGRAHPALLGRAGLRLEDAAVGLAQDLGDVVGLLGRVLVEVAQGLDGDPAGDLPGRVAAHAVGDGEDHALGEDAVLVVVADPARRGWRRPSAPAGRCRRGGGARRGSCGLPDDDGLEDGLEGVVVGLEARAADPAGRDDEASRSRPRGVAVGRATVVDAGDERDLDDRPARLVPRDVAGRPLAPADLDDEDVLELAARRGRGGRQPLDEVARRRSRRRCARRAPTSTTSPGAPGAPGPQQPGAGRHGLPALGDLERHRRRCGGDRPGEGEDGHGASSLPGRRT